MEALEVPAAQMDPTALTPITLLRLSLESDKARASLRVSPPSNGTWRHREPAALEDCMHYHFNAISSRFALRHYRNVYKRITIR